ncbi:hypothetical protein TIFTF001_037457 [Ficus carica]|uniref:Uncharacterized protein n=1 Tax=Ficus carica TaxID=3494 RepID=A0AA88E9S8_FICCA|nr:hypothetical protein TIFTF001_037457 [Ficus carica]
MSHGRGSGFRFGGKSPVTETESGAGVSFVNSGLRFSDSGSNVQIQYLEQQPFLIPIQFSFRTFFDFIRRYGSCSIFWRDTESRTGLFEEPSSALLLPEEQEECDRCPFLHSWSHGDHVSIITTLQGHTKAVTGIAYPLGGDQLYSGSIDRTLRVWNCHTGQCERVIDLGFEVCSLIREGLWIFVGLPNLVKAWNTQSGAEFSLDGPVGQVYAMIFDKNILFAGA